MENALKRVRFAVVVPVAMISLVLLLVFILYRDAVREIANQKATGLGAVAPAFDPLRSLSAHINPSARNANGVVGAAPGGARAGAVGGLLSAEQVNRQDVASDKKLIRTVSLELIVKDVRVAAEQLRRGAEASGGELEGVSIQEQEGGTQYGQIKLRIPAKELDATLAALKKLAIRVQNEEVETKDVTREYLDSEARLRNMRAEEQQYLLLLKRAGSMKDTLEVTEKLSEVRGQIERMQGDLNYMSRQVAMSAVEIRLLQEADAHVAGLHWRPLYNAKVAARDVLSGLADWVDFLVALILKLPLIVLWLATVIVLAAVGWKVVRWMWRRLVPARKIVADPSPTA